MPSATYPLLLALGDVISISVLVLDACCMVLPVLECIRLALFRLSFVLLAC